MLFVDTDIVFLLVDSSFFGASCYFWIDINVFLKRYNNYRTLEGTEVQKTNYNFKKYCLSLFPFSSSPVRTENLSTHDDRSGMKKGEQSLDRTWPDWIGPDRTTTRTSSVTKKELAGQPVCLSFLPDDHTLFLLLLLPAKWRRDDCDRCCWQVGQSVDGESEGSESNPYSEVESEFNWTGSDRIGSE